MRITTIAVLAGLVAVTAPLAAQTQHNTRVQFAMAPAGKYSAPICPIKGGDFHTNSAALSLKAAAEGVSDYNGAKSQVDTKKYLDLLEKAVHSAEDGIAANPQSAAAWYFLARAELQLGNLIGADTAFTRTEKLSPECAEEIKGYRQRAWIVLVNPSTAFLQNKQFDSALAILREANIVARYYPQGYYNLAATFANMKPMQPDSAIYYFKLAADKSTGDPALAPMLKGSIQNAAYMYQAMGDNANAVIYFKKYLTIDPNDNDVKRALASTLRLTGNTADAVELENQLMAAGTLNNSEISSVAVRMFNDKDYAGAAAAFKKILETDPFDHDALSNLANSYLALFDGKNLLDASQRLMTVDPLGKNNVKLLANGYRLVADTTKWLEVVTQLQAMTVEVAISSVLLRKDGMKIIGTAIGSEGRNANDKIIPPTPITLVFEFYDAKGAIVTTQEVAIPALAPDAKQEIVADGTGAAIISWKYHKK